MYIFYLKKPLDFIDACVDVVLEFRQHDNFENVFACPIHNGRDDCSINGYVEHILKTKVPIAKSS